MEHKVTIAVLIDPNEYMDATGNEDGAIKVALEILRKRADWPQKLIRIQCGQRYLYANYNLQIEKDGVNSIRTELQPIQEIRTNKLSYEAQLEAKDAEIRRLKKELQETTGYLQGALEEVRAALKICRSR